MVLMNSASRSRNIGSLITQDQGGGNTKAGFPYQVGHNQWFPIFYQSKSLSMLQKGTGTNNAIRPINMRSNITLR